jgi:hypothetical protein
LKSTPPTLLTHVDRFLLQFLAALNQAGLVKEKNYEFTSKERIFQKRFEAFEGIQQPPSLLYDDYVQGSDFSKVAQNDLLMSTSECFNASKTMVDKLLSQMPGVDTDYIPMRDNELRRLAKVCIGNSVYVQKLKQKVGNADGQAEGDSVFDLETHNHYCTVKIS